MCASCGCGKPEDQHGDAAHITRSQVEDAASAANISPEQAAQNISEAVRA